jgi:SAM-dependent methyltransferase
MGRLMQQTPIHDRHNPDLLSVMQPTSKRVLEVGCSSGALAREFKRIAPSVHYTGVEIDPEYAELAKLHCDSVYTLNIDDAPDYFWEMHADVDAWIFGDTLEHLKDPWKVLTKINKLISKEGYVAACIPNAQHWSIQARLSIGDFRYQSSGLMDITHLRWFTRQTIKEMFTQAGYRIVEEIPREFNEHGKEAALKIISDMANLFGYDRESAMKDASPLQYVIRAIPI